MFAEGVERLGWSIARRRQTVRAEATPGQEGDQRQMLKEGPVLADHAWADQTNASPGLASRFRLANAPAMPSRPIRARLDGKHMEIQPLGRPRVGVALGENFLRLVIAVSAQPSSEKADSDLWLESYRTTRRTT